MKDVLDTSYHDILLHVADTIFLRHTTGAITASLSEYFRHRFNLTAAGFMTFGTSGDPILDVSTDDASSESMAAWRGEMELSVTLLLRPEDAKPPSDEGIVVLSLRHDGELQGALLVSEAIHFPPEALSRIGGWLYRHRQMKIMAAHDPLTGLHNRGHIEELSVGVLNLCRLNHQAVSLAMLDLDHFKSINDAWGHHRGDQFLAAFADQLRRAIRASDLAFRLGGDEFMIIMPDTSLSQSIHVARQIREQVERMEVPGHSGIPCRISVGLVQGVGNESWQELQVRADKALYLVKRSGRDNIAVERPGTGRFELIEATTNG